MIKIEKIIFYYVSMRLKKLFKISIEILYDCKFLIVEVIDEIGRIGWGEVLVFFFLWYIEEMI